MKCKNCNQNIVVNKEHDLWVHVDPTLHCTSYAYPSEPLQEGFSELELDVTPQEFNQLVGAAKESNMTVNEFIVAALRQAARESEVQEELNGKTEVLEPEDD